MTGQVATARVTTTASPDRVWTALTDPELIASYMMGAKVETDWQVGSPITWSGEFDGKPYQDKGEVLEFEPSRTLTVTHYSPLSGADDVPENYHTLRYELTPTDEGTALTLTQDGNASTEEAEHAAENWQMMMDGLVTTAEGD